MVRFRNLTTGVVGIPAGTVVRTTGSTPVRFATTSDAVVAAGVGKTMDVPVQAVQAGTSGNLVANALVAIEGDLGASLVVSNPGLTAGGKDRKASVQTAEDRSRLRAALLPEILAECKTTLAKSVTADDLFFPDTVKISQVVTETYFPAANQSGDTLSLTMTVQCQAHFTAVADVESLAKMALGANLPTGFEPISGTPLTVSSGLPVTGTDGQTRWEVKSQRLLQAVLSPLPAVQLALGRTPADAASRISKSLALDAAPRIQINPSWWPWMPVIPFRISVNFGRPAVVSE
jgi:hypothetical protein